jgi:hypothetical protein
MRSFFSLPTGSSLHRLAAALLLWLGVIGWLRFGVFGSSLSMAVAAATFLVLLIPPIRGWAADALDRVRRPSSRSANWTAVGMTIGAALLLYGFALGQGRPFVPTWHDEHVNLIQMQMLARGRLWMPQPPLADFFEAFYLFVKPVYAGIYPPGTALLYVPTVWLHLPYWFMSLLVAGAVVGMTYRVLTELVDGVAGLLGGLMVLSLWPFRLVSVMMMSQPLMAFWGLMSVWTWLQWRRQQGRGWALLLGIVLGWAAITRPLDALCFAVPIAAGVLWDLRGQAMGRRLVTVGLVVAGTVPFLSLQLIASYGITGNLLELPAHAYTARLYPGLSIYAPFDPRWKPESSLLQQQLFYQYYIAPDMRSHTPGSILPMPYKSRLPVMLRAMLPDPILLILLPVGILGLTTLPRLVVLSIFPIFILAYAVISSLLMHYALPVVLQASLALILGIHALAESWPRQRRAIGTILTLVVASFAITAMPGIRRGVNDQGRSWPVLTAVHRFLPRAVQTPAVVLFPFHRGDDFHEEPVYNVDVAWPDDAPIIHAQDLGPERNQELAAYYAKTQPDRTIYRFDRRDYSLVNLGKAKDFLASLRNPLAAAAPDHPPAAPGPAR